MFDWISSIINAVGSFGVAVLMFVENVFPPIPSELVMPLAGFNAARGDMSIVAVIIMGSLGSLAGAWLWYWIGQKIGMDRLKSLTRKHGRWLTISPDELDQANDWFARHGGEAVLIGRLIPTVRTFISVPAGVSGMPLPRFLAYSAVGTVAWTSLLAVAGYMLETQYERVSAWLNPVSTGVVVIIVAIYLYRVATYRRRVPLSRTQGGAED
ncbi:DedA family protein [Roseicyclus sp. F158]|uniref:DedA family protein n=1 Tax=Tropicimonas omnivorans TaxID=3075590 RepID=A0ABU3DCR2_9RHOB|nr:DedA family protein [Roseicyclus sp. F158]MDT0681358.1 DedA family protein [Roseicyclus sp. F158]